MAQFYFPLRWESTGDQWWYASPIDWAAANGHYDLVRELLYLDTNLLIKLTSLRRTRRLETLWDDDPRFADAARCRAFVARNLLLDCETTRKRKNTLLRAGYGGWLLYTAASAGDVAFVRELLERDRLLVFGQGEYGVTDMLYAAARSRSSEVFRILLDCAARRKGLVAGGGEIEEEGNAGVFRWEMVNRAVHAAARGGNLEMLRQLVPGDCSDVLAYRDAQGSTFLHAASGRGQVQVVKYIISSFNIINSRDNQGNTPLHIAAFRGYLPVAEALLSACPSSSSLTNNTGDTFLHMAVAGFRTPGFRRLDRQMELMKQLLSGTTTNIQEIINVGNNDGRTVLHVAIIGYMNSDLVELLMTAPSIDLNIRDINGMTPLDLLSQRPRSASSEILIKQLVSAGGIFALKTHSVISALASQLRKQNIRSSPGTTFKVPDAEIFLYTGIKVSEPDRRLSSCSSSTKSESTQFEEVSTDKKQNPVNRAANKLKVLLKWPLRKEKNKADNTTPKKSVDEEYSMESLKRWSEREDTPTPLRERFSKGTSLVSNKRALSVRSSIPSPPTKKKFAAGLMHGVIQAMPHLAPPSRSPSDLLSMSGMSTPNLEKGKEIYIEEEMGSASCSNSIVSGRSEFMEKLSQKPVVPANSNRVMNQYFCFGAQRMVEVKDSMCSQRSGRMFKGSVISAV